MPGNVRKRSFTAPDNTIEVEGGRINVLNIAGVNVVMGKAEPGWKWSEKGKSFLKTESCQLFHNGWVLSGRMKYRMDDGTELEFGPGDVISVFPGHDAWVEGDEPVEYIEILPPHRWVP